MYHVSFISVFACQHGGAVYLTEHSKGQGGDIALAWLIRRDAHKIYIETLFSQNGPVCLQMSQQHLGTSAEHPRGPERERETKGDRYRGERDRESYAFDKPGAQTVHAGKGDTALILMPLARHKGKGGLCCGNESLSLLPVAEGTVPADMSEGDGCNGRISDA